MITAARFASSEIVEILLRRDPQQYEIRYDTDLDDKNPLHVAAERDDGDVIKVYMQYQSSNYIVVVCKVCRFQLTPFLHWRMPEICRHHCHELSYIARDHIV